MTLAFVATLARRSGPRGAVARAVLYNGAGSARLAAGDSAQALAWLRSARAAMANDPSAELAAILGNLAMVVDDLTSAMPVLRAARGSNACSSGIIRHLQGARGRVGVALESAQVASGLREILSALRPLHRASPTRS